MHEERLRGRVGAQGAVEDRILPAVKGRDGILLECIAIYGMLPMGWISAQDSHGMEHLLNDESNKLWALSCSVLTTLVILNS